MAKLRIKCSLLKLGCIFKTVCPNHDGKYRTKETKALTHETSFQIFWQCSSLDHWNFTCTPVLCEHVSTVLTHTSLKHHSSKTFCLMTVLPLVSSNSFNPSPLISATSLFIKMWSSVFPVSSFPPKCHCHHWWHPSFERFLCSGSWSWHPWWAVVSKHLPSAADLPLSLACSGRQWSASLLCPAPCPKGKRRSLSPWDFLSPCMAYSCWICSVPEQKSSNCVWLKNGRKLRRLSSALMILVMNFTHSKFSKLAFLFSPLISFICVKHRWCQPCWDNPEYFAYLWHIHLYLRVQGKPVGCQQL